MERDQLTLTQAAELKGISSPALRQHVQRKNVFVGQNGRIDLTEEINQLFFGRDLIQKYHDYVDGKIKSFKTPRAQKGTRVPVKRGKDVAKPSVTDDSFDPIDKIKEEIRWKRVQTDLKSLEYGQKLGLLQDYESIIRKFNPFVDFIVNGLIHCPRSISDMLVSIAQTSDEPQKEIEKFLSNHFAVLIQNAKAASKDITAPVDGVTYVIGGEDATED